MFSCMIKAISGGGGGLWTYFFPYKMGYFPVTLVELCVDLSFIMSLKIVGVSLKKPPEIM